MRISIYFAIPAVLFILLFSISAAQTQPSYSIRELSSDSSVSATGINDAGQIVGSYTVGGATRAFLYQNGVFANLGTLGGPRSEAGAISANGNIAGNAYDSSNALRAFLSSNGGPLADLGALGLSSSIGYAVNSAGQVAGYAWPSGSAFRHPF